MQLHQPFLSNEPYPEQFYLYWIEASRRHLSVPAILVYLQRKSRRSSLLWSSRRDFIVCWGEGKENYRGLIFTHLSFWRLLLWKLEFLPLNFPQNLGDIKGIKCWALSNFSVFRVQEDIKCLGNFCASLLHEDCTYGTLRETTDLSLGAHRATDLDGRFVLHDELLCNPLCLVGLSHSQSPPLPAIEKAILLSILKQRRPGISQHAPALFCEHLKACLSQCYNDQISHFNLYWIQTNCHQYFVEIQTCKMSRWPFAAALW